MLWNVKKWDQNLLKITQMMNNLDPHVLTWKYSDPDELSASVWRYLSYMFFDWLSNTVAGDGFNNHREKMLQENCWYRSKHILHPLRNPQHKHYQFCHCFQAEVQTPCSGALFMLFLPSCPDLDTSVSHLETGRSLSLSIPRTNLCCPRTWPQL